MKSVFGMVLGIGLMWLGGPQGAPAAESRPPLQVLVAIDTPKGGPTVKLTIVNVSNTRQRIQGASCSWEMFWTTDDKHAQLAMLEACFSNALTQVTLAPGEKYVEPVHPLHLQGTPGKHKIRIGYVRYIAPVAHGKKSSTRDRSATESQSKPGKEIFWSAPLTVEVPPSL